MKNLNKFSKAELITKLKNNLDQNQKQSNINKIIDLILSFKSLILKITLITFIIRWIKKYSLIKKLWHLFSIIGSSLLGLSMIDIYVLDLINWIQNTSIYRWYFELFKYTKPIDKTEEDVIPSFMRGVHSSTTNDETTNSKSSENIGTVSEWINRKSNEKIISEDIMKDTSFWDKYKYAFIAGTLSVTVLVSWYYYGDNITPVIHSGIEKIKTGWGALVDYITSFRGSRPDDPGGSITSDSTMSNKSNITTTLDKYFKLPDAKDIERISDIELHDKTQPIASSSNIDKGKGILTSPSFENLNETVKESWAESSGSRSPDSASSSSTITQEKFTDSIQTSDEPFINVIAKTWKSFFSPKANEKIKLIESIFNQNNRSDEDLLLLVDSLAYVQQSYDAQVEYYFNNIERLNQQDQLGLKGCLFHLREWIQNYQSEILPELPKFEIGLLTDEPTKLFEHNLSK